MGRSMPHLDSYATQFTSRDCFVISLQYRSKKDLHHLIMKFNESRLSLGIIGINMKFSAATTYSFPYLDLLPRVVDHIG